MDSPALTPAAFDKRAWLQRVCQKPFHGSENICLCGYNFGDGSGVDAVRAEQHELSTEHKE